MSLNVANCPNCGAVYQKNFRNMCVACSTESDNELNSLTKYLWKNPKSTTEELSHILGIEVSTIIQFVKKGLISKCFPNLTYPCGSCGSPITDNRLCGRCTGSFKDLAHQMANPKLEPSAGFKIRDRLRS